MANVEVPAPVSRLPLLIMGAVVTMAVLVTIALVAFRDRASYPPGSPEAAVQDFVQTGLDEDPTAVLAMLTTDARSRCQADLDNGRIDSDWYTNGLRAELQDMSVSGDTATAEVRFRQSSSDDPFDSSTWTYDERFTLLLVDGEWRIDRTGWPHQFAECTRGDR